ncbi:MAG: ATP-dependent helicase [Candidatus Omnitrophota bacterium]|nr:ATP-dependent helicase [Candidatus Omnitrophota bacterium]MDZ4241489.1 ATP-dependent helicase [Candidatus Omnitrophota bacterium]
MNTILEGLNPSQRKAVEHEGGHLLIVAGPGTGKTHTLACRIARLAPSLAKDQKVLAITFTNKAAEELRQRLLSVPGAAGKVVAGTFHSFCLQVLREFIGYTDLPKDFRVASLEEIEEWAKEIWPDKKPRERREALEIVSAWKSSIGPGDPPEEVKAYSRKLRSLSVLDFDDLLLEALYLLQTSYDAARDIQGAYRHVFVDEYQDINAVQHALLKQLVRNEVLLTAIGDPNQAIYGFRGSDVRFFKTFAADFPAAAVLSLSENYRSAQNLLSASSQVIAKARFQNVPEQIAKILEQGRLTIHDSATDKAEAEFIVHQIEKMVGGTSMFSKDSGRVADEGRAQRSFGDIAVLYRLNSQARELKLAFERSGIPFRVSGEERDEDRDDVCPPRSREAAFEAEKVSLMSLHASKGLEFPAVFIAGCEETLLPLNLERMTGDPDEERRLFYVGMTRAKEQLFLLRARRRRLYGKMRENAASPFLSDIAEALKEYEKAAGARKRPKKGEGQMTLFG